jgi:hypothetical protein
MAVDGRAKNKDMTQSQLSGTLKNSQHNNEDMVSMMSVDEMPIIRKRLNRNQRKRAGIISPGNKLNEAKTIKTPRLKGHRKRVHWEVNEAETRTKQERIGPN